MGKSEITSILSQIRCLLHRITGVKIMGNYKNCKKKKPICNYKEAKDIGFVLIVFGIVTVCAFFLPPKAWILLLGAVLVICGISLLSRG